MVPVEDGGRQKEAGGTARRLIWGGGAQHAVRLELGCRVECNGAAWGPAVVACKQITQ